MNLISSFLSKFSKLKPPQSAIKRAVIGAVQSLWGITLTSEQVRVRSSVAYIEANPMLKSELRLKKQELLHIVNRELSAFSQRISDIR